jgi:hypothetical protein
MPAPTFLAGERVKASKLQLLSDAVPRIILKTADQARTNSTALTNDTELLAAVAASTRYKWRVEIIYGASTTGDLKIAFTWPAGATCPWGYIGYDTALAMRAVSFHAPASGDPFSLGGNGVGNDLVAILTGTLTVGVTAGNLRFQIAQNALDAVNATTVRAGSSLTITKE